MFGQELSRFADSSDEIFDVDKDWLQFLWSRETHALFSGFRWTLSILTLGIIGPCVFVYGTRWFSWPSPWFEHQILAREVMVFIALLMFVIMGNESIIMLVGLPLLIRNLSHLPLRVPHYYNQFVGLPMLGNMMFRIGTFAALGFAALFVGGQLYTPLGDTIGSWVAGIFLAGGLLVLMFFVLSTYNLHVMMRSEKQRHIRRLESIIYQSVFNLYDEPSAANVEMLQDLQSATTSSRQSQNGHFLPELLVD